MRRGILQHQNIRKVLVEYCNDPRETARVLSRPAHLPHAPIDRCERTFEQDKCETAGVQIDGEHERVPSKPVHTTSGRSSSKRASTSSRKSSLARVVLDGLPCNSSYNSLARRRTASCTSENK